MKYKVGDKVRIKSLEWYNSNKDNDGNVPLIEMCDALYNFVEDMHCFCGKIVTITNVWKDDYYDICEDDCRWYWTDEMIEGLVESSSDMDNNGTPTMISLEDAAEWVKNAFIGTFGEGLANGIKDKFIKAMTNKNK